MRQAAAYFRSGYGVNLPEAEIMDGGNARIEAFYRKTAPAKEGVRDFLHALRQSGVKMCVATATDRPLAEAALRRTGLQLFFLPSHLHRGGLRQGQSGYFCIGTEKTGHTAGTDGGL